MPVTVLRVFNIVSADPRSRQVLAAFIARARQAAGNGVSCVEMDSLEAVRDFVTMPELVASIAQAVTRRVTGEVINVCSGEPMRVRDLLERARTLLELPVAIVGRHAEPGSWSVGDPTKCQALLGIAPSGSLTEALADVSG
jgi:nucleoside-diphosphate-sugar epimerase